MVVCNLIMTSRVRLHFERSQLFNICFLMSSLSQTDQKCDRTEKASRPVKLSFAGCRSLKKFQPRYCGSCSDGRCCRPHRTQTSPVRFRCRNGEIVSRMVMMIKSCECDLNCPGSHEKTSAKFRLYNDITKLKKF